MKLQPVRILILLGAAFLIVPGVAGAEWIRTGSIGANVHYNSYLDPSASGGDGYTIPENGEYRLEFSGSLRDPWPLDGETSAGFWITAGGTELASASQSSYLSPAPRSRYGSCHDWYTYIRCGGSFTTQMTAGEQVRIGVRATRDEEHAAGDAWGSVDIYQRVETNTAPTADFSYSPSNPAEGESVTFWGLASDPDGSIASYQWDWQSDGTYDATTDWTATHTYSSNGPYMVTLKVTDNDGATSTASQIVNVQPAGPCGGNAPADYGESCTVGTGACRNTGTVQCDGTCSASAGNPSSEACNGVDDDCDGRTDEGGICDATPPSTSASVPTGWQNTPVTVTFSASDTAAAVRRTEFCTGPNCNPGQGRTGNRLTIDTEGVHTVRFRSVDSRGNTEAVQSAQVKVDLSAPGVTVAATGQNGATYNGGWSSHPIDLGASCQDQPGLSGCQAGSGRLRFVDGPGVCPGEGNRQATSTYDQYDVQDDDEERGSDDSGETGPGDIIGDSPSETGTYWVCAGAQDRAANVGFGGSSPDAMQVQVDTTDPSVSASPSDGWQNEDFTVDLTYGDEGSGLDTCSWTLRDDGAVVKSDSVSCSGSSTSTTVSIAVPEECGTEGSDTCDLNATATDVAGNTGTETFEYDIDTTVPSVSCDDCARPDPVKSGNEIEFDPAVSDPVSGVSSVNICKDEQCQDVYCSGDPCTYTTPDNTYSVEEFWVRAEDNAGNSVTAGSYNYTVKKWVGDSCSSDAACLLGDCTEAPATGQQTCEATTIPEPGIYLQ